MVIKRIILWFLLSISWSFGGIVTEQCNSNACFSDTIKTVLIWNSNTGSAHCIAMEGDLGVHSRDFIISNLNSIGIEPDLILTQDDFGGYSTLEEDYFTYENLLDTLSGKPDVIIFNGGGYSWSEHIEIPTPYSLLHDALLDSVNIMTVGNDALKNASYFTDILSPYPGFNRIIGITNIQMEDGYPGLSDATRRFSSENDSLYMVLNKELNNQHSLTVLNNLPRDTLTFKPYYKVDTMTVFDPEKYRCQADVDDAIIDTSSLVEFAPMAWIQGYDEEGMWSTTEAVYVYPRPWDAPSMYLTKKKDQGRLSLLVFDPQTFKDTIAIGQLLFNSLYWTAGYQFENSDDPIDSSDIIDSLDINDSNNTEDSIMNVNELLIEDYDITINHKTVIINTKESVSIEIVDIKGEKYLSKSVSNDSKVEFKLKSQEVYFILITPHENKNRSIIKKFVLM